MPKFSRKKGTITLITTSYISLALVMVKGIVLIPIYLAYIDDRLYGAWLATGSIVAYFSLLDFGLNGVLVQRVASNYGKGDLERLGSILGTGLTIGLILSCMPLVLGFFLSPWVSNIVHVTGFEASQLRFAFILAAAGTSLMLAMYNVGGVLVALQRQIVHGAVLIIGDILGIVATLVLLRAGYGLLAIPAGTIVWAMVSAFGDGLFLWWFVKRKLPQVTIRFRKEEIRDLSLQSAWQFGSQSAATIARKSDNLIVGALIDPRLCTVLTLTKRASEMLALLVRHFARAFLPSLAHLHGEDDREKFKRITFLLFRITSFLGICLMGGYLFLNENFISLWVGPKFFGGYLLTGLFCICGFFMILGTLFYSVIFAKGEMITAAQAYIGEALIRIPLCIVLVRFWGIKGVALAAILAMIPTSFLFQAKKFVKILNLSRKDVLNSTRIIVLQTLVALTVGIVLSNIWRPEGIVEFVTFGGLYLGMTLAGCLLFDRRLLSRILFALKSFLKPNG